MSLIRLRCKCKKIIKNNDTEHIFVITNYNQNDMEKIIDRELFLLEKHKNIKKIKSFGNSQEFKIDEIIKSEYKSRKIYTIISFLNDIIVKSNINIEKLIEQINKNEHETELFLYVKLQEKKIYGTLSTMLLIYGVEIQKKTLDSSIDIKNKITQIIKQNKKENDPFLI